MIMTLEELFDPRSHVANNPMAAGDAIILDFILKSGRVRPLVSDDQYTKDLHLIELEYSGNAPTMAFQGFTAWVAESGAIGPNYAIINFDFPLTSGTRNEPVKTGPRRVSHKYRIYVFDGDLKEYFDELSHFRLEDCEDGQA